jgi:hypothetical protein
MRIIPASRDILKIKKRPQKAKGFKNQKNPARLQDGIPERDLNLNSKELSFTGFV